MTAAHESLCVCVRSGEKERVPPSVEQQNRPKAACVSKDTHAFTTSTARSPTLPRIHTNYKRTNGSERKGGCIQIDYIGGGRCV